MIKYALNNLMPNYDSFYKQYCNTKLKWLSMDTEELYKINLAEHKHLLEKNNWIDNPFTYSFNSKGFRCNEFTSNPTIMFLGCSFTCGIGLPVDAIWPELVANTLGMHCANFGQGGGSSDTAFRLCHGWIDRIKPKIVIFLQPPGIRWELVCDKNLEFLGFANDSFKYFDYKAQWGIDENNNYFNKTKNSLAIEHLCNSRQIKFLKFNSFLSADSEDLARDLKHSGIKSHQLFAKQVCKSL